MTCAECKKVDPVPVDPYCDPNRPIVVKYEDVESAVHRVHGAVRLTPCVSLHLSNRINADVRAKLETMQYTGGFKERGCRNTLLQLSSEQKRNGVIAASLGNHAQAIAYNSELLKIPCTLSLPYNTSINKVMKCERYSSVNIIFHGQSVAEARDHALRLGKEKNFTYINGYDHPHVVAGQGTCGVEICHQVQDADIVLAPCGGGSLLTGVCIAVKHIMPNCKVYGVETEKTNCMSEALKAGERVVVPVTATIADGLAVGQAGVNTFATLKNLVDDMIVVNEDWVARALMYMLEEEKFILEGAGATGFAAILAGQVPNIQGKKVVVVASGGNIDAALLARATERGMSAEGRLLKFRVTVPDRPGGVADLCTHLSSVGAVIRDIQPETTWVKGDIFSAEIDVIVETRGWNHLQQVEDVVKSHYTRYEFVDVRGTADKKVLKSEPCQAPVAVCDVRCATK